jgi:hypothetical protein
VGYGLADHWSAIPGWRVRSATFVLTSIGLGCHAYSSAEWAVRQDGFENRRDCETTSGAFLSAL